MNHVLSLMLAAILGHSSIANAEPTLPPEPYPPGLLQLSIDVVKAAHQRGKIVDCPTDRCQQIRQSSSKAKGALIFIAWTFARKKLGAAAIRSYIESYATKALARYGLAAAGIGLGVYGVVAISVIYSTTVDYIEPLDARELADDILFNAENRARLLAMPTAQIVMLAEHHPVLADQLVVMAHEAINASEAPIHPRRHPTRPRVADAETTSDRADASPELR